MGRHEIVAELGCLHMRGHSVEDRHVAARRVPIGLIQVPRVRQFPRSVALVSFNIIFRSDLSERVFLKSLSGADELVYFGSNIHLQAPILHSSFIQQTKAPKLPSKSDISCEFS